MMMKNEDLYTLQNTLERIKSSGSNSFKLNGILNKRVLKERINALEQLREPSGKMKELFKEQRELMEQYCIKDKAGNPIVFDRPDADGKPTEGDGFYHLDTSNQEVYTAALKKLQDENSALVTAHTDKENAFAETLQQEAEPIELHKLKFEDIPELDEVSLEVLYDFLVENN